MKILIPVLLATILTACTIPKPDPPDEPYNIKANETIGIKLGMNFADYRNADHSADCKQADQDDFILCNVHPHDPTSKERLTIAGTGVHLLQLEFYKDRLISIAYFMDDPSSLPFGSLTSAFEDKFGKPTSTDSEFNSRTWSNSVATMIVSISKNNWHAHMWLNREDAELTKRRDARKNSEVKKDL